MTETAIVWLRRDLRLRDNPALSAAVAQRPELVVVQDADAGLGTVEMSWFSGVCHEVVNATDTTVLLVGEKVTPAEEDSPELQPAVVGGSEGEAGDAEVTTGIPPNNGEVGSAPPDDAVGETTGASVEGERA